MQDRIGGAKARDRGRRPGQGEGSEVVFPMDRQIDVAYEEERLSYKGKF